MQVYIKEATAGKNLHHLLASDRIFGFLWEVQLWPNGFYTFG